MKIRLIDNPKDFQEDLRHQYEVHQGVNTTKSSSPGQIFLFGEHAVVYGQPALATAIDIKTEVDSGVLENKVIEIDSNKVGKIRGKIENKKSKWKIKNKTGDLEKLQFVIKAVEITLNHLDKGKGLKIDIKSDIPLGSGLGSSSAVTTATIASVSSTLGMKLEKDEISKLAFDTEEAIQGAASRTGVNVATYGGFLRVQGKEIKKLRNMPELKILIGCTGKHGDTGRLVAKVRRLKEKNPKIIEPIIEAIGKTVDIGISSLRSNNLEKIGTLMNANQNLLEGLKVSSPELRKLIQAAKDAGALGAKLTGGGGGGCMIALSENGEEDVAEAIRKEGGTPLKAKIGAKGLRY